MMRFLPFLPMLVVLFLVPLLYKGLHAPAHPEKEFAVPRALPDFRLPLTEDDTRTVGPEELRGAPALLNVWASWCVACRIEHPFLIHLVEREGVRLFGLNYKDDTDEAHAWLNTFGNPYRFSIADTEGRLGLDLGVTGAPETLLLDHRARVRLRHVGELNERVWNTRIAPMLARLQEEL